MRVLFVSHTALGPEGSGSVKRNFFLWKAAAERHRTRVLILDRDPEFPRRYGSACTAVTVLDTGNRGWRRVLRTLLYVFTGWSAVRQWHRGRIQKAIDALCAPETPDIIHLSTPLLRSFRYPAGVPIVADAHNVEHETLRRIGARSSSVTRRILYTAFAMRVRSEETRSLGRCAAVLATSHRDKRLFQAMAPGVRVNVVPNGVDGDALAGYAAARKGGALVFTGVLDYPPNEEGILLFLGEMYPLIRQRIPEATLTIVGPSPSAEILRHTSAHVTVTGWVPDVRPYLAEAAVAVVPLYAGGGTRLKILEAMALGAPVVSTTVGCEGLEVRHGEHLLVADEAQAFADAVCDVLCDQDLRRRLTAAAREKVRRRYDWRILGRNMESTYSAVTQPVQGTGHQPAETLVSYDAVVAGRAQA